MIHTNWNADLVHKCNHQQTTNIMMSLGIDTLIQLRKW